MSHQRPTSAPSPISDPEPGPNSSPESGPESGPDSGHTPRFEAHLARNDADLKAAQRLRYEVFVRELGGAGEMVDHEAGLEQDQFDPFFDHLLLRDLAQPDHPVVGVYRLMRDDQAAKLGRFYSDGEYDLTALRTSGRRLLELGRSCLQAEYRGGMAMYVMWQALADYVAAHQIEVLFGVASFSGTDAAKLAHPLSHLHHRHLAPPELRVQARDGAFQAMDLLPPEQIDRKRAMLETPSLIKAYLRLGGVVGHGAWVDHAFNTIDVCLIMDTQQMNARSRQIYGAQSRVRGTAAS